MVDEVEIGCPSKLPEELEMEILFYLPVKSLLRFTCVCKSWLRLIKTDHQFAMKHYVTRATSSCQLVDNVDCMLNKEMSGKICMYLFTEAKTFRPFKKFDCIPPEQRFEVSNSCHGIICFRLSLGSRVLLCNPSIREVMLLPPCPNEGRLALGFDPFANDYKIVTIASPVSYNSSWTVDVYSVGNGEWHSISASDSLQHIDRLNATSDVASNANGRMCSSLAWKVAGEPKRLVTTLVSFDMVEEIVKELPMPECLDPKLHDHKLLSSSRWQACISCLSWYMHPTGFIDVWVLHGSTNDDNYRDYMWSKELVVKFPDNGPVKPLNFWLNDRELLMCIRKGDIEEVFHYNIGTQQLKRTGRKGYPSYPCEGYVESLVSIQQLMLLHHDHKHGEDIKLKVVCGDASKQEDNGGLIFREVGRKGVQWSCRLNLV